MAEKKAWGGRFKETNDPLFEKMNRSLDYDIRLYKQDIKLNKAYSAQLNKLGIITDDELTMVHKGLDEVEKDIADKGLQLFSAGIEDIHMGVEALLTEKIGDAAKKIHSGKSRNDQVATDVRMYVIDEVHEILGILKNFMQELTAIAEEHLTVIMPGYTHLRQAQPVLFSHYLMSFVFSLQRDYQRLFDAVKRISIMPLGSAALAGSALALDREQLRIDLGFDRISDNSMDGVSGRDFILEILSDIAILSTTLSRYAEDFIMFSSEHFKFIALSDKVSTGSSIMPNKKNPDSLELTRGKTGRLIGNFVSLFTVLKSLPSTYNKDLQEDKEQLFDTIDTIKDVLSVNVTLLQNLIVNKEIMKKSVDPLSFATELADYLTGKNIPFREAHHIVGKIVIDCIEADKKLTAMTETDLCAYHKGYKGIGDNWHAVELFLKKRDIYGGTGIESVKKQIRVAKDFLLNN